MDGGSRGDGMPEIRIGGGDHAVASISPSRFNSTGRSGEEGEDDGIRLHERAVHMDTGPPSLPRNPCFSKLLLRGVGGGLLLYLSFISRVTLLVMRPHRRPPKNKIQTPTMMTDRM